MRGEFIGVWSEAWGDIWVPLIDEPPVAVLTSGLTQALDTASNPRGFQEHLDIWNWKR